MSPSTSGIASKIVNVLLASHQDKSDQDRYAKRYKQHIAAVIADRSLDAVWDRCVTLALQHFKEPRFIKIDIDAMDQSKYAIPRHPGVAQNKGFGGAWRPRAHVAATLTPCVAPHFWYSHECTRKGANLELTMVMLMVERLHAMFQEMTPPVEMPTALILRVVASVLPYENKCL